MTQNFEENLNGNIVKNGCQESKNNVYKTDIENNNKSNFSDERLELVLFYLCLEKTLPTFKNNNICFNDLFLLSENDMIELGFSLVEKNRLLHFIASFKEYTDYYSVEKIKEFFSTNKILNIKAVNKENNINEKENEKNKNSNLNSINVDYFNIDSNNNNKFRGKINNINESDKNLRNINTNFANYSNYQHINNNNNKYNNNTNNNNNNKIKSNNLSNLNINNNIDISNTKKGYSYTASTRVINNSFNNSIKKNKPKNKLTLNNNAYSSNLNRFPSKSKFDKNGGITPKINNNKISIINIGDNNNNNNNIEDNNKILNSNLNYPNLTSLDNISNSTNLTQNLRNIPSSFSFPKSSELYKKYQELNEEVEKYLRRQKKNEGMKSEGKKSKKINSVGIRREEFNSKESRNCKKKDKYSQSNGEKYNKDPVKLLPKTSYIQLTELRKRKEILKKMLEGCKSQIEEKKKILRFLDEEN